MKNEGKSRPAHNYIPFCALSDAFRSLQTVGKHNIVISAAVISAGNTDRLYINLSSCLHLQFSEGKVGKNRH